MLEEALSNEFPIKNSVAYFNNASYTPMGSTAARAITRSLEEYSRSGPSDDYYLGLKRSGNEARARLAELVGAGGEDFVFTESATQSINLVANGFKFDRGNTMICRGGASEHPSNYLPWRYYSERKGVTILDLATDPFGLSDLAELDSTLKRSKAKLVVMSHVLYNLGTIMPASEVARVCHERGAYFFLDASQSVGNIPVNLKEIDCDFAAGTAAKWLCGPLGLGFLYCKKDSLDSLEPLSFGPNACTYTSDGTYRVHDNTSKLEEGFRNWAYCFGLIEAIDVANRAGIRRVREENLELADTIVEALGREDKCRMIGPTEEPIRTSILPFELSGVKPIDVVQRLAGKMITVAEREIGEKKILRISPHYYNDQGEVDRLVEAIGVLV